MMTGSKPQKVISRRLCLRFPVELIVPSSCGIMVELSIITHLRKKPEPDRCQASEAKCFILDSFPSTREMDWSHFRYSTLVDYNRSVFWASFRISALVLKSSDYLYRVRRGIVRSQYWAYKEEHMRSFTTSCKHTGQSDPKKKSSYSVEWSQFPESAGELFQLTKGSLITTSTRQKIVETLSFAFLV